MSKKKRVTTPAYCHHKATGQGYVFLNGKRHYLGPHDNPETRQKYHRMIAEWEANDRRPAVAIDDVRVLHLIGSYWSWAKGYYRDVDGEETSQLHVVKSSLRVLKEFYADLHVSEFGVRQLKTLQHEFVTRGLARSTVNMYVGIVKRCFRWGVAEDLVPASVYGSLQALPGLHRGRSKAKETEAIEAVSEANVEAVRPYVSAQVWALIQLQLLTAARPGELVSLRPIDFDTKSDCWVVRPVHHKTSYRGRERIIHFGPKAK
ncbi:MAG: recombinase XerD, partial [Candidatus Hydrogenedentota bacterium]